MRICILFILFFPLIAAAQEDTDFIEQYCRIKIESIVFSNKVGIDIDTGQERKPFGDYRIKDEYGKTKTFATVIAALNYMGRQGWLLVDVYPPNTGSNTDTWYLFRKRMRKAL